MVNRRLVILLALVLGVSIGFWPPMERLEQAAYNWRYFVYHNFQLAELPLHPALRLVGADQASDKAVEGGWGTSSEARMVQNLTDAGAVGVLFDKEVPGDDPGSDELRAALESSEICVLGTQYLTQGVFEAQEQPEGVSPERAPIASTDAVTDSDGIVRKAYLAVRSQEGTPYPSAALLLYARLKKIAPEEIRYEPGAITVGNETIRTDPDYAVFVRVLESRSLDMNRLFEGESQASEFMPLNPAPAARLLDPEDRYFDFVPGKIVIYGPSDYTAEQQVFTPLSRMRNIQLQACLLDTLLAGWSMERLPAYADHMTLVALVFLVSWLCSGRRPLLAFAIFLSILTSYVVMNFGLFFLGYWLALAAPILGATVAFFLDIVADLILTFHNLRKFGGATALEAARSLSNARLAEVREKVASIVFCNIPEHLKNLERLGSPEYFKRRKEFSQLLSNVCREHRGRVLDFQGDAQMVGFGVDLREDDPTHAYHAVRAALEFCSLQQRLAELWWDVDSENDLRIQCGVATGVVALGQVGSGHKSSRAAIGDTTNVAARLLGQAKKLGCAVVVLSLTRDECAQRLEFRELPMAKLKGKTELVKIYEALT